ncbi:MAG: glutamate-5-semialdehyde dehydrogenase [Chthoniobacterales bacterium]
MTLLSQLQSIGQAARDAASILASSSTEKKNTALLTMAHQLLRDQAEILSANEKDLTAAAEKNMSLAMLDRLKLDSKRLHAVAESIRTAATLPDPVGKILRHWKREDHLDFEKITVPIGVIGIIYESRPNVTADAAVLCLKAGNACILRGGSEAFYSNMAIAASLQRALLVSNLPATAIQLIPVTDREAIKLLCELDDFVHCLMPRGGKGLIETVTRYARMPVIKHYDGICIAYVDKAANLTMAEKIILDGKCKRPTVCNALETVLLHSDIASEFLETAGKALLEQGVELRCDQKTLTVFPHALYNSFEKQIKKATEEDFKTEFLSLTLALKIVTSLEEATAHIDAHGSHHSDVIISENREAAEQFLQEVDSATVYWNASTRFTDGGEFGFGAEIGISTDKLHARGPMGLEELTSYKYIIRGNGQTRG